MPSKSTRMDRAAAMAAEMAGLAAPAAGPAEAKAPRARAPRKATPKTAAAAPAPGPAARAMAAETGGAAKYGERVPLTTTAGQKRALELARVEDGIQATARLRAMVALWMEDDRIRTRVNKLAKNWK